MKVSAAFATFCLFIAFSASTLADNDFEADSFWLKHSPQSTETIDHSDWQNVLDQHLIRDTTNKEISNLHRVDYAALKNDSSSLDRYLNNMAMVRPYQYNRAVQFAFWVNLYNAQTVKLITDNYPTKSITKLGNGWFSFGPWDESVLKIDNKSLSLNDIEHRILRPIWQDYRIHFVVNCASLGCPNLPSTVLTAANMEKQLDDAAFSFLNHERGLSFSENGDLTLSKIFKWYDTDFGDSIRELLTTLQPYLSEQKQQALSGFTLSAERLLNISYQYDWNLNDKSK